MNSIDTLKTDIRQWEKTFIKKYGRKPTKSDIATDKAIGNMNMNINMNINIKIKIYIKIIIVIIIIIQ